MIKFFRKIRQKLLTENKFSKYLIYAIGEIILVVIGILIALQINDWNENRKNNEINRTYYLQLLKDLEKDKIELTEMISMIDSFSLRYQTYIETFDKPYISLFDATTNMGKIGSLNTSQINDFEMNSTTINTLLNTGNIILMPLGIRNKMLKYKAKQSSLKDYAKAMNENLYNSGIATSKLFGGGKSLSRTLNQPQVIEYLGNKNIETQIFLELESNLEWTVDFMANIKDFAKELIMDIDDLIIETNEELKK